MKKSHSIRSMILAIVFSVCTSGCATVLTHSFPPVTETKRGESIEGDRVGYTYSASENKDGLILLRQPLCRENIQITEVKRKQLHGVMGAILEIPFFGLGIVDLVTAGIYSKATMEEIPKDPVPGTALSPCGGMEPAPGARVTIQYPASLTVKRMKTDPNGIISYSAIRPEDITDHRLTIFVNDSDGLNYVKSLNYDFP